MGLLALVTSPSEPWWSSTRTLVRLPPLGAWSWSSPGFLSGTGKGFSFDDDFQADPLSCESLPKP
jgi:hypothetical protein